MITAQHTLETLIRFLHRGKSSDMVELVNIADGLKFFNFPVLGLDELIDDWSASETFKLTLRRVPRAFHQSIGDIKILEKSESLWHGSYVLQITTIGAIIRTGISISMDENGLTSLTGTPAYEKKRGLGRTRHASPYVFDFKLES